jgi:dipeptidyl-peptidase-4
MGGVSWDQALAHRGFLVWQMDNRGSAGRGHAFETPLFRRMGKIEVEDQKDGVRYLASLGFADPARVGINGWSYGGYMALQCLLHAPEVFKAGIAGAAVSDWRNYDTIYTERYMGLPQDNEEGYRLSSPVHHAANLKGKLLLVHNMQDDNVLFANALQMMNALQQANRPYETLIYPQKSHGVMGKARTHMNHRLTEFFEENLK